MIPPVPLPPSVVVTPLASVVDPFGFRHDLYGAALAQLLVKHVLFKNGDVVATRGATTVVSGSGLSATDLQVSRGMTAVWWPWSIARIARYGG